MGIARRFGEGAIFLPSSQAKAARGSGEEGAGPVIVP